MQADGQLSGDEFTPVTVEVGHALLGPFTLTHTGPSGSGRYWEVGVSFESQGHIAGFCLMTSTEGWRRVGGNVDLGRRLGWLIRWVQDVDGDGGDELVVPSSFAVSGPGDPMDEAITVVVYDRQERGFVVDENSTRMLRAKIADAYAEAARIPWIDWDYREHYRGAERQLRDDVCIPRRTDALP
jgi:hypothetical protein